MSPSSRRQTSHAEQLRSRRSAEVNERAQEAVERIKNPVVRTPPVMARGRTPSMAGAPGSRKKAQPNVRRKYYYTLPSSGTEVRLPALPQVRIGWRLLSGLMVLVFGAAALAMWSSPNFQVEQVRVIGAKRIPAAEVNEVAGLQGLSILEANPTQLKQTLQKAFPDMATINVEVGLPADVIIRVKEREPIMVWQEGDHTQWIDQEGFAFPARGDSTDLITVQAEGNLPGTELEKADSSSEDTSSLKVKAKESEPKPYLTQELIGSIQKIGAQVPPGTPVLYSSKYGLGWNDPQQGWKVYIGMDLENMDLKLKQYQVIVDDLNKRGIHPVLISVEFPHAPFYRLES